MRFLTAKTRRTICGVNTATVSAPTHRVFSLEHLDGKRGGGKDLETSLHFQTLEIPLCLGVFAVKELPMSGHSGLFEMAVEKRSDLIGHFG
jgi:hypothetical protein